MLRVVHPLLRGKPGAQRRGITLLEVLLAVAIFLFSLAAVSQLINVGGQRAEDIRGREEQLCQSKLDEVACGALQVQPGSSQEGDFDEAPGWHWSVKCQPNNIPSLWNVTVTVTRKQPDGTKTEAILTKMVFNPGQLGSSLDPDRMAAAYPNLTTGSSQGSSQQNSGNTPDTTGGGAAKPPATNAMKPPASNTSPKPAAANTTTKPAATGTKNTGNTKGGGP